MSGSTLPACPVASDVFDDEGNGSDEEDDKDVEEEETEGDIGGMKHEQASPRFCSEDASAGVM